MSQHERARLVRVSEVAAATGLSGSLITKLADNGTIPFIRPNVGGNRFYDVAEVLRALKLADGKQEDSDMAGSPDRTTSGCSNPSGSASKKPGSDLGSQRRDGSANDFTTGLNLVLAALKEGRKNLEREPSSAINARAKTMSDFHINLLRSIAG